VVVAAAVAVGAAVAVLAAVAVVAAVVVAGPRPDEVGGGAVTGTGTETGPLLSTAKRASELSTGQVAQVSSSMLWGG
jgi:hypothetical protein